MASFSPLYDSEHSEEDPNTDLEGEEDLTSEGEKARIREIESNRLYLRKVKKQCVKEDFADLGKLQLFLFESLIESLKVDSKSDLGLMPDHDIPSYIAVKVQFLNSPYLDISEEDTTVEDHSQNSVEGETNYMQAIGQAGLEPYPEELERNEPGDEQDNQEVDARYDIQWENEIGKSCLFPLTVLEMIRGLEQFPLNLQVVRCIKYEQEEGWSKKTEPIGYAQVYLPQDFSLSVLQSCKTGVILPVTSVHRETCEIRNVFGVKKGRLQLFVRLSSFGPTIITSFQTVGADRQYIFKPSPMLSALIEEEEKKREVPTLSPIFSEEQSTYGISVLKQEDDIFQKPMLWKMSALKCDYLNKGNGFDEGKFEQLPFHYSSMRLPVSSEIDLCRDAGLPTGCNKLGKFGDQLCDWHNMVSLEIIKSSPRKNCGCLPSKDIIVGHPDQARVSPLSSDNGMPLKGDLESASRYMKMLQRKRPLKDYPTGFSLKPESKDCVCKCPEIRDVLESKKLFLI